MENIYAAINKYTGKHIVYLLKCGEKFIDKGLRIAKYGRTDEVKDRFATHIRNLEISDIIHIRECISTEDTMVLESAISNEVDRRGERSKIYTSKEHIVTTDYTPYIEIMNNHISREPIVVISDDSKEILESYKSTKEMLSEIREERNNLEALLIKIKEDHQAFANTVMMTLGVVNLIKQKTYTPTHHTGYNYFPPVQTTPEHVYIPTPTVATQEVAIVKKEPVVIKKETLKLKCDCGREFTKQGLTTHKRSCKFVPTEDIEAN